MIACRNCGAHTTKSRPVGRLAAFFADRVLGLRLPSLEEVFVAGGARDRPLLSRFSKAAFALIKRFPMGGRAARMRISPVINVLVCETCGFVGPQPELGDSQLGNLYRDYRSKTYNDLRCFYEPEYAAIADVIGSHPDERRSRLAHVDGVLEPHLQNHNVSRVLDWGGGTGKFVPTALQDADVVVLDVSSEPLFDPSFKRIETLDADDRFDYVQLCHVLEHVMSPLHVLTDVVRNLNPGGFVYVEVPQDRSDDELAAFVSGDPSARHTLHEHINLYSRRSLEALGRAAGLSVVDVHRAEIMTGAGTVTIVAALFRAPGTLAST